MEFKWNEEIRKCKEDQVYFFKNYCLIGGRKPSPQMVRNFETFLQAKKEDRIPLQTYGRRRQLILL